MEAIVVFPINEAVHSVPIAEPTLPGVDVDQVVLRRVPEDVPESEAVRSSIAREPRPQALPEQLAALFKGDFKVLGAYLPGETAGSRIFGSRRECRGRRPGGRDGFSEKSCRCPLNNARQAFL